MSKVVDFLEICENDNLTFDEKRELKSDVISEMSMYHMAEILMLLCLFYNKMTGKQISYLRVLWNRISSIMVNAYEMDSNWENIKMVFDETFGHSFQFLTESLFYCRKKTYTYFNSEIKFGALPNLKVLSDTYKKDIIWCLKELKASLFSDDTDGYNDLFTDFIQGLDETKYYDNEED